MFFWKRSGETFCFIVKPPLTTKPHSPIYYHFALFVIFTVLPLIYVQRVKINYYQNHLPDLHTMPNINNNTGKILSDRTFWTTMVVRIVS